MKISAAIANGVWMASGIPAWLRFCRALQQPKKTQEHVMYGLLQRNGRSAYGRSFGFENIQNYNDFKERIPIVDYNDLEPWINRIKQGEEAVLTVDPITNLIPTSGSAGGRKLIPFTSSLQREFNAAISPWIMDLFRQYSSLMSGTAYWSISPVLQRGSEEDSAVSIGFDDDSSYLGGVRRKLVEATFAVPSVLRMAPDMESFRYLTLLCLLRQPDLTLISVWHPSFLGMLLDSLPIWWEELIEDVKTGVCRRASSCSTEIQDAMNVRGQPARAQELNSSGSGNAERMWPHLKLVSCWGDGHASLGMSDLKNRLPQAVIQAKGLLATEAFVTLPFQGFHPLAVTSHFFEFCNLDGNILRAHELQHGETYSVIVTTGGGLWRYRLGDMVEVNGFVGTTPSLRFMGREGNVSDLYGEKLAEGFVTNAISEACKSCDCSPRFAMLAPDRDKEGEWSYTLFIEGDIPMQIAARLDALLCENPNYDICRNLNQLGPIRYFQITNGGYATFVKVRATEGQVLGSIKPQALSTMTKWASIFEGSYRL